MCHPLLLAAILAVLMLLLVYVMHRGLGESPLYPWFRGYIALLVGASCLLIVVVSIRLRRFNRLIKRIFDRTFEARQTYRESIVHTAMDISRKYQARFARPFVTGARHTALALVLIGLAALVLGVNRAMTPTMIVILAGLAALSTGMCFGYAYVGHIYGARKARWVFYTAAVLLLVLGLYVLEHHVIPWYKGPSLIEGLR